MVRGGDLGGGSSSVSSDDLNGKSKERDRSEGKHAFQVIYMDADVEEDRISVAEARGSHGCHFSSSFSLLFFRLFIFLQQSKLHTPMHKLSLSRCWTESGPI
jgi:hypothetical protein